MLKAALGIVGEVKDKSSLKSPDAVEASAACMAVSPFDDKLQPSLVRHLSQLLVLIVNLAAYEADAPDSTPRLAVLHIVLRAYVSSTIGTIFI